MTTAVSEYVIQRGKQRRDSKFELGSHVAAGPVATNLADALISAWSGTLPISIFCQFTVDTAAPAGTLFEIGNSVNGVALHFNTNTLHLAAGASGDDGVDIQIPGVAAGRKYSLYCLVNPGNGKIAVFESGRLIASDVAVNNALVAWNASPSGAVGQVNGTQTTRVGAGGALSNATLTGPVLFFHNKLPRAWGPR